MNSFKYIFTITISFIVSFHIFYYVTNFESMKPLLDIINIENQNYKQFYCSFAFAFIITITIIIIDLFLYLNAKDKIKKLNK